MSHPAANAAERRWRLFRRRLNRWIDRRDVFPRLEIGFALLAAGLGVASYAVLAGEGAPKDGYSPALVTFLLVANLLPLMALIVLIARRIAILVTRRRQGQAGARLHIRFVALFSTIAAVPTLLVVVFASLLFQFGVQFWFSDRARTVLENADRVAQAYVEENKQRIVGDIRPMAIDVARDAQLAGLQSPEFRQAFENQVVVRGLTEASIFSPGANGVRSLVSTGMFNPPLAQRLAGFDINSARLGRSIIIGSGTDRVEALIRIDPLRDRFLYVSRRVDPEVLANAARTQTALSDYKYLIKRSRELQVRFNLLLVVVSLLILSAAIWFALWLANRMMAPIARLAEAAERVGAGDFSAQVQVRGNPDELATLARTFNRMTTQIQAQKNALVTANAQLDGRRQFTEAVLSGVSAGVLSIDRDGIIRLANDSAEQLLAASAGMLPGSPVAETVPALLPLLDEADRNGSARGEAMIARGSETQTLAVQVSRNANGFVLTFDDISQQLTDQRRAAWSDVARRIAHEIKNPLTPIQLSAERLQRKYARQIVQDREIFDGLTGTIVRQVGDLRRMVDEFSSFARMPKPVFRPESLLDIARQAVFLHEVGHPGIRFKLEMADNLPLFVCDRRQIAQALTNLLKNAAEAVTARHGPDGGEVGLSVIAEDARILVAITDNGIGLPVEQRDRLTEPYVTTRARGTGLGLAIVKKIVEEHQGSLDLCDLPGGGTLVRMSFDTAVQPASDDSQPVSMDADAPRRAQLRG